MHKMAHDMFLVEMDQAVSQWRRDEDINKIMNFIPKSSEWIVLHINSADAPTSGYLMQKMKLDA